jgi:hypothetical protein
MLEKSKLSYCSIVKERMVKVNSSTISEIGYDAQRSVMSVKFKTGAIYEYLEVPQSIYDFVINSESVGKALNAEVKGVYEYQQV